jgi:hypothetical protein
MVEGRFGFGGYGVIGHLVTTAMVLFLLGLFEFTGLVVCVARDGVWDLGTWSVLVRRDGGRRVKEYLNES